MSVRGVFAKAHISDDEERWKTGAQQPNGLDDGTIGVIGRSAEGILSAWSDRHAKQDDRAQAFVHKGSEVGQDFVYATAVLIREGRNERLFVRLIGDEKGVYEHGFRQLPLRLPGPCKGVTVTSM